MRAQEEDLKSPSKCSLSKKISHGNDPESRNGNEHSEGSSHHRENLKPKDDLNDEIRDWVYLEDVPDYLKCNIICCSVFDEPQLLKCCGRNICKRCIDSHLQRASLLAEQKPSCPLCRTEEVKMIENTTLKECINQLMVQCHYKKNGCGWTGTLRNGKLHLKECDFFPIECPNKCNCKKFERRKLAEHISECSLQVVSCSFESVGCCTENALCRKDIQKHSDNSLHHHLFLVAQSNSRISSECSSALDSLQYQWRECERKTDELVPLQKQKLASLNSAIEMLEHDLQELQLKTRLLKQNVKKQAQHLLELRKNNELGQTNTTICDMTTEQICALKPPKPNGISCPPVLFTVNRFSKRMAYRHDIMWLSSPFYTHIGGYKMCVSMRPITIADRKADSIAFIMNIHLLSGEFDDHLIWPFQGAVITVSATSRHNVHCNKSVHLELSGEYTILARSKQVNGSIGGGVGEVMSFEKAQINSFLINDRLTIMVYRVQFLPS